MDYKSVMTRFSDTFVSELTDDELREVASLAPVLIWRAGPDRRRDWFNRPWLDFVGRSLDQEVGTGWTDGVHPDDHQAVSIVEASLDEQGRTSTEYRLRRQDGVYRWMLDTRGPFYRDGTLAGYFGSCVDISHMKHSVEGQQRLINELNHRVKNALVTVQSIAAQTFRNASDKAARALFDRRLMTLAKTHDMLTRKNWTSADLLDLVTDVVAPYRPADRDGVSVEGGPVHLESRLALALAFGLNELCVNATQHGALSAPDGRVTVSWQALGSPPTRLRLHWIESGGPEVRSPAVRGFGLRLLGQLERELEATVTVEFQPSGLECVIDAPLSFGSSGPPPSQ